MGRKNRRIKDENKIMLALGGGIILIGIIAFIISYVIFSNNYEENTKIATEATNIANNFSNITNTDIQSASSSIGKSVNEVENTTKFAVNTTTTENTEKNVVAEKNEENSKTEKNDEEPKEEVAQTIEDLPAPTFSFPIDGEILKDFSKENLVYSDTLDEWTTHLGIDFKANKTDIVKASADGVVKTIKNDPRYGLTIVLEHEGGFESVYSSLLSSEFVTVGESVKAGDAIGTVGNTATFEITDETHLHFELKKDGSNVDPNIYLK